MLDLPILNVRLRACPEDWQQMTPTTQGRHCHSCNREVVDFTHATQADVQAARAAAPDGRLCGRFRREQLAAVQPQLRLRLKLRRFEVALVLVCGLGLSSQQAAAQVQKAGKAARFEPASQRPDKSLEESGLEALQPASQPGARVERTFLGEVVEVMPTPTGGFDALFAYLRQNLRYLADSTITGKVFVGFVVTKTGAITEAKVIKGLGPDFDAEALRLVQQMPAWQPARQNNKPVDLAYTLPIRFGKDLPTAKEARRQERAARRRH